MERLFIESPDDLYTEAMEERFNTIVEYLQECVDDGIMEIEDANDIANMAYTRYISEASAEMQALFDQKDAIKDQLDDLRRYHRREPDYDEQRRNLLLEIDQINENIKKLKEYQGGYDIPGSPKGFSGSFYKTKDSVGNKFENNIRAYKAHRK